MVGVMFVIKQKTAYEVRISDWSSDVCSSDLAEPSVDRGWCAGVRHHRRIGFDARRVAGSEQGARQQQPEIGRASCRESVCQYVSISVVAGSLHKNIIIAPVAKY